MADSTSASKSHDPVPEIHDPAAAQHNSRLGLVFCAIYILLYGGFVALNTFAPAVMARPALFGVNLAIVYGIGLIVGALVLAPLYMIYVPAGLRRRGESEVIYNQFPTAVVVFLLFIGFVLGLSFYLGRRAKSSRGYFAAHGEIHWFVNGFAFAGDYLSAASFLGICGIIAFYGYDGFLYSIGYLAGWIVALFVIAEPLKRLGKFTFADALDKKFNSHGIKLAAAISTLVVSMFYLIPQMVGAGALVHPLLGYDYSTGVIIVGVVVITIVVTAGMLSTTWVQFIKGSLLIIFCTILTGLILHRGLSTNPSAPGAYHFRTIAATDLRALADETVIDPAGTAWEKKPYVRTRNTSTGIITTWHKVEGKLTESQTISTKTGSPPMVNGLPQGKKEGENDLHPVGTILELPDGQTETGPLGPIAYLTTLQNSKIVRWAADAGKIADADGYSTTVYNQKVTAGSAFLVPGQYFFKGSASVTGLQKLNFISLMLALFCGTASLPHILIRVHTVKDQASARKSTVVGIASIGFFYVLTLFLGLGAATSGGMDLTNSNMAAPLLARSFSPLLFAVISAIAFTTVLGTVSGLILAASGAVAHDIMKNFRGAQMDDHMQVRAAKVVAVVVGIIAMGLGILFQKINVTVLVSWAFNIAASANLPALVMLLFWKRTTKQGIAASIVVGLLTSLAWVLLGPVTMKDVYGLNPDEHFHMPFDNPAIVTIPLSFIVLVVVSLLTPAHQPAIVGESEASMAIH